MEKRHFMFYHFLHHLNITSETGNAPNLQPTSGEQCTFFDLPNFKWVDGPCGCARGGKEEGLEVDELDDYEYEYEYEYEDYTEE